MIEFTCYICNNTYEEQRDEEWNSFKAGEEYITLYPEGKNDPSDILCDDCYQEFIKWFSKLTEDEKKKMRADQ